jgi:hypothetical protein
MDNEITVEEAKDEKRQLEKQVAEILKTFSEMTGLRIEEVNITTFLQYPVNYLVEVKVVL